MNGNETIFVFFGEGDYLFKRMFKKGYRHVFILMKDGYNWTMLEMRNDKAYIEILSDDIAVDVPVGYINNGYSCVEVEISKTKRRVPGYNILNCLNCVSFVKMFLGLRKFIHSPHGLYKYLNKMRVTGKYKDGIVSVKQR